MADWGLLGGLAEGFKQGLGTYMDTKKSVQEEALRKKQAKMQELDTAAKLADVYGSEEANKLLSQLNEPKDKAVETNVEADQELAPSPQGLIASGMVPTGVIPKKTREMNLKKGDIDKTLIDKGYTSEINPKTGEVSFKEVPLGQRAMGEKQEKQTKEQFEKETSLRKEYEGLPEIKRASILRDSFNKIKTSAAKGNAAGDMSLIYGFMKMNDPESSVREGEFATAQNSGSVDESLRNAYNKALSGQMLTPDQRYNFLNQASALYKSGLQGVRPIEEKYSGISKQYNMPENRIFNKFQEPSEVKFFPEHGKFFEKVKGGWQEVK